MSRKAPKQGNKFNTSNIEQDIRKDKKVNDTVDRARMSWILNLVLNQKTQKEIVKDIADGIINFKEIEDIFPWKFVQGLRQCTPEYAEDHLNRFKNMTDERMKGLLTEMMSRKSRDEIFKLITDHSLNLDNIQKSYLRRYMGAPEESESSTTANVSTSSEKMLSKDTSNININKNSKEPKDAGTKKKRNTAKKGEKDVDTKKKRNTAKKDEKDADTKKKGNKVEKATKKVRVVKSKNEKRVDDMNGGNEEASKEILSTKENPLSRVDGEKASGDLTESLTQTRHEGFEESTLKPSQEDRDTKKTANSENLASENAKLAGAKKASKKVGKDVKPGLRNKGNHEVENFASLSRSDDSCTEENEKSKGTESDVENENAGTSYVMGNDRLRETRINDRFEDSLQKSRTNEITNVTSATGTEEQDMHGNKENELNHVREYNFNIQLNASTPKKLNWETKTIRIKEEPESECSFNKSAHPIDRDEEKDLNISKEAFKNVDSKKNLRTKRNRVRLNTKLSNTSVSKLKKVTEPSKIAKTEKTGGRAKKEITGRRAKDTGRKENAEDKWTETKRLNRKKESRKEKLRRREKKIQKAMAQFSGQVVKLVKNMGYLEEDDESSSSYSSDSSYTSSSESCSCSCDCCDDTSSDDYSEYTLCSCSNCNSSCSDTDSDYNYDREE